MKSVSACYMLSGYSQELFYLWIFSFPPKHSEYNQVYTWCCIIILFLVRTNNLYVGSAFFFTMLCNSTTLQITNMFIVSDASNEHYKFNTREKNILFCNMKTRNIFSFTCCQGLRTATCFYTKNIGYKHFHFNKLCIKL